MPKLAVFLTAAFGGILPSLLPIARNLADGQDFASVSLTRLSTYIGVAMLGILGGVFALIWQETDAKKVFYLGLGLPSFIIAAGRNPAQSGTSATGSIILPIEYFPRKAWPEWIGSSVVLAQAKPSVGRFAIIEYPDSAGGLYAIFRTGEGKSETLPIKSSSPISVPPSAISIQIEGTRCDGLTLPLSEVPHSSVQVKLAVQEQFWFGFQYSLGWHARPFKLVQLGAINVQNPQYVLEWNSLTWKGGAEFLKPSNSWDFVAWINGGSPCHVDNWVPRSRAEMSLNLKRPPTSCDAVQLSPLVPVRLSAQVDSLIGSYTSASKFNDLPPPTQEGPVTLDIRGDVYFVLDGRIRKI